MNLDKNIKCPECEGFFRKQFDLDQHIRAKHSSYKNIQKEPICSICAKKFKNKEALKQHIQAKHTNLKPKLLNVKNKAVQKISYNCSICIKSFKTQEALNNHNRAKHKKVSQNIPSAKPKKTNTNPNFCTTCVKKFKNQVALKQHIQAKHNPKVGKTSQSKIPQVIKKPTGKPAKCTFCEVSFKKKNALRDHLKKTHPKKCMCPHCNQFFWTVKELNTHFASKIHSNRLVKKPKKSKKSPRTKSPRNIAINNHTVTKRIRINKRLSQKRQKKFPSNQKKDKYAHLNLFWLLVNTPTQDDLNLIKRIIYDLDGKCIREDSHNIHFRIFNSNGSSLHIKLELTAVGIKVYAHVDVEIHGKVIYNNQSREILIGISDMLKKAYGQIFSLPREKKTLKNLIGKRN